MGGDFLSQILEALIIDLGVGRAPGSDRLTAHALNPYSNAELEFPRQVLDLQAWVSGLPLQDEHPFGSIKAHPLGPTRPELWMLGSSDYGAQLAAHFGLPYAFAYFFTDGRGCEEALQLYRRNYRPSESHPSPQATICVWASSLAKAALALSRAALSAFERSDLSVSL